MLHGAILLQLVPKHRKKNLLQIAEVMLRVTISGCNLQWLQNNPCNRYRNYNRAPLCAIFSIPTKFRDKLQRGHVTSCNPPVTCLATPLQHKLQRKLHRVPRDLVTLEISETIAGCSLRLQPEIAACFSKTLQVASLDCKV